jgi:hypothetical protein
MKFFIYLCCFFVSVSCEALIDFAENPLQLLDDYDDGEWQKVDEKCSFSHGYIVNGNSKETLCSDDCEKIVKNIQKIYNKVGKYEPKHTESLNESCQKVYVFNFKQIDSGCEDKMIYEISAQHNTLLAVEIYNLYRIVVTLKRK